MSVKLHIVPREYNATPRRVSILARYIADMLKARQATMQAKGKHYVVSASDIADILDGFVSPDSHALSAGMKSHPQSLFKE